MIAASTFSLRTFPFRASRATSLRVVWKTPPAGSTGSRAAGNVRQHRVRSLAGAQRREHRLSLASQLEAAAVQPQHPGAAEIDVLREMVEAALGVVPDEYSVSLQAALERVLKISRDRSSHSVSCLLIFW